MATTTGLVQFLNLTPGDGYACAFIGPSPSFTEGLMVRIFPGDPAHVAAFKSSMVEGLAQAMSARREVVAGHDDNGGMITSLELR